MTKTYTTADLCALPDDAIDTMAAELRGYHQELIGDSYSWFSPEIIIMPCEKWHPTTDRNQSGDLLAWAVCKGVKTDVCFRPDVAYVTFYIEAIPLMRTIPGDDARAETIAFCAAMLAMAGRLKGE